MVCDPERAHLRRRVLSADGRAGSRRRGRLLPAAAPRRTYCHMYFLRGMSLSERSPIHFTRSIPHRCSRDSGRTAALIWSGKKRCKANFRTLIPCTWTACIVSRMSAIDDVRTQVPICGAAGWRAGERDEVQSGGQAHGSGCSKRAARSAPGLQQNQRTTKIYAAPDRAQPHGRVQTDGAKGGTWHWAKGWRRDPQFGESEKTRGGGV